jgi:multiple sugar transport system substrate-binding protein
MNRRQFLCLLAATPAAAIALAACTSAPGAPASTSAAINATTGPATASDRPLSIRFDSYNWGTPGLGGQGTQQLVDEFQAAHPNITIQPRNVASTDILKSSVAQAAAGDPPDVAQLVLNNIDFVVRNLPVQPLDQIAPTDEFHDTMKHILPQAAKLGQVDGHQYGGPYTFSTPTLFYNGDVFRSAGLDPSNPPTTWEQVRGAAQSIKDRTSAAPLNIGGLYGADWIIQSLINSNGGATLSTDRSHATFNESPAVEVITWWQGMVNDGLYPKLSDADAQASMTNGTMGMFLNTTVLLPALRTAADGKWDLRTSGEPSFGSKPVVPTNSGSALFVMSKAPEKQLAAWEFLRFAASQRGNTIITSVIGYVPQRDDVVDDPNYLKPFLDNDPRMLPTIKQLGNLQAWTSWPGKNAPQAVDVFMQALANVVYGGQDSQSSMDAAAQRVDQYLHDG